MAEIEDWLQDPLRKKVRGAYKSRELINATNDKQSSWHSFHFATRLKLDGADFFLRQALGAASMSDDLGLPLLAHREKEWYLEAFFFEIMSAYETLFQELNVVYAFDLRIKLEDVRWNDKKSNKFMQTLPQKISTTIQETRKKDWLDKLRNYRNMATHHYTIPLSAHAIRIGSQTTHISEYTVNISYIDKKGNYYSENIIKCKEYLKEMTEYIKLIWRLISKEFKK